jgi:hypothetical protein
MGDTGRIEWPTVSRQQFEAEYLERSNLGALAPCGLRVIRCDCREPGCRGWAVVAADCAGCGCGLPESSEDQFCPACLAG